MVNRENSDSVAWSSSEENGGISHMEFCSKLALSSIEVNA
jgi:hypothetical protein